MLGADNGEIEREGRSGWDEEETNGGAKTASEMEVAWRKDAPRGFITLVQRLDTDSGCVLL